MPRILLSTEIAAPPDRVFDLSRSIDLHMASTATTGETAIAGRTSGLIGPGEEVTWRARHFGVWQRFTSRITSFDRPRAFRDEMVRGAFARFGHDHFFDATPAGTRMRDELEFASPLWLLGAAVDAALMTRYLRGFLVERNETIRRAAESGDWRRFLPG